MKIKLGLGNMTMADAAVFCGGDLYDFTGEANLSFSYICTDSREADAETLFVAIRGERVDGHDYIVNAMEAGCRCFLCEYVPDSFAGKRAGAILTENSVDAFGAIANGYRKQQPLDCVAVTGSVGKTTTKEFISTVLSQKLNVYRTEGNFNSTIGMPMSMMEVGSDCNTAVFEMGMSGFGEISGMSRAATPKVAVITNIGSSHLEYLGTRENICKAKMEICDGLQEGGTLVLNGDEPLLANKYSDRYNTVYVSVEENTADVNAKNIRCNHDSTVFDIDGKFGRLENVKIPEPGKHLIYAALFAFVSGKLFGLTDNEIMSGIAQYAPTGLRQRVEQLNGYSLLIDCYNAAPESMKAALGVLKNLSESNGGNSVAVLGDMRELGTDSSEMHKSVGKFAVGCKLSYLLTVGEHAKDIAEGAKAAGMNPECVYSVESTDDVDSCVEWLTSHVKAGDSILFKASRAVRAERIVEAFKTKI